VALVECVAAAVKDGSGTTTTTTPQPLPCLDAADSVKKCMEENAGKYAHTLDLIASGAGAGEGEADANNNANRVLVGDYSICLFYRVLFLITVFVFCYIYILIYDIYIRRGGLTRGCAGVGVYEDAGGVSQGGEGSGRDGTCETSLIPSLLAFNLLFDHDTL
jgi:hypothetical protein